MKLTEIKIGEEYAVSVNEKQVDLEETGLIHLRRHFALSAATRKMFGYHARVVGFEISGSGQKVVRVELSYREQRTTEYVEDHLDGTRTKWRGYVEDEDGMPVEDEIRFEAVIQPSQVKMEWTEAVVQQGVQWAERTLRHPHLFERYFKSEG